MSQFGDVSIGDFLTDHIVIHSDLDRLSDS